jgi:beta-galactosidase
MRILYVLCFAWFNISPVFAQQRTIVLLDTGWKFIHADVQNGEADGYNDNAWESVTVPHDWVIKGPFDKNADAQMVMVTEDGERKPALKTGRTGSLPWTGVGWYRKKIFIPESARERKCFIEFDGAMSHAVVYLNGECIGTWPFGYASFSFELTHKIRFGKENIIAVRLENFEESSRWYPGAGLYRNVRMVFTNFVHVKQWGTYITTTDITAPQAVVHIRTEILNQQNKKQMVQLQTTILDPSGKLVASASIEIAGDKEANVNQQLNVPMPLLWDIKTPLLYEAVSTIIIDHQITDVYNTSFGIRTIKFDNNKGFILNGKQTKIKGVCNHHDLGPLGAAVNYRALQRQLEILKEMGCNAIRTSHNPPAPELLELCDKMGFLVMDEAFDEWKIPKCKNGYNTLFDEWAEKDLRALIRRDRNHPCVVLWSIGNEVPEQKDKDGAKTAKFLVDISHNEDPTRLTTSAFNSISNAVKNGLAAVVDVVGLNYWPENFAKIHQLYPQWKLIGSETESTISSRGEYMFPVKERKGYKYKDKQVSSYDVEFPSWGNAPDIEFAVQDENEFIAGQFVWTGFDYLGEPTPYNNDYPSHSYYFGIIDLAGIPKDRYFLYQSNWTDKKVLHLWPHWNWKGNEGEIVPVYCYTSYNTLELFLNGKSLGIRKKDTTLYGHYRLTWDSVRYEPGLLKVVALDKKGKPVAEESIQTAGSPAGIKLVADRMDMQASGKDLCFITVSIVDKMEFYVPGRIIIFNLQ